MCVCVGAARGDRRGGGCRRPKRCGAGGRARSDPQGQDGRGDRGGEQVTGAARGRQHVPPRARAGLIRTCRESHPWPRQSGAGIRATRHNVGWWVVDHLADVWRLRRVEEGRRRARASGLRCGTVKTRLVKPQTYMNLSGRRLRPYLRASVVGARDGSAGRRRRCGAAPRPAAHPRIRQQRRAQWAQEHRGRAGIARVSAAADRDRAARSSSAGWVTVGFRAGRVRQWTKRALHPGAPADR